MCYSFRFRFDWIVNWLDTPLFLDQIRVLVRLRITGHRPSSSQVLVSCLDCSAVTKIARAYVAEHCGRVQVARHVARSLVLWLTGIQLGPRSSVLQVGHMASSTWSSQKTWSSIAP